MRNAEKSEEDSGMSGEQEGRCRASNFTKAMAPNTKSNWKRKPFSDISQVNINTDGSKDLNRHLNSEQRQQQSEISLKKGQLTLEKERHEHL